MAIRRLKIITVDDSPIVTQRLQLLFDELDNVEYLGNAINATDALALIMEQKPNVVFLDIHLEADKSTTSGLNLLLLIRKRYPEMKIIMLTNLAGNKYRETSLAFGADYFLDKTLDFDKIPGTLKEIVHQNNSLDETDF